MGNNKSRYITLLFFFYTFSLLAQQNSCFVYFNNILPTCFSIDKPDEYLSKRAIENRERIGVSISSNDLPVNPRYIDSLESIGASVVYASKWLNGALIKATLRQNETIRQWSFVSRIVELPNPISNSCISAIQSTLATTSIDYGNSKVQNQMIGVNEMHDMELTGKGVLVAVLDDGFKNVNTLPVFGHLFLNNRIRATYDFVSKEESVFEDGGHGTKVLSILAGYDPGNLIGTAWDVDLLLLRTEDAASETLLEEYNWVRAAEYADSAGASIISSSLGYNNFDNPSGNHSYEDLNGDKTPITIGADIAASKGILVVNAAGNEGANSWKHILAPADGDSVLAIGGVDPNGNHVSTSSIGPSSDGRIKPDLVTFSNNVRYASPSGGYSSGSGTSFATPAISGLAAGLKQAFPAISNMDLIYFLKLSASQYQNPDNLLGYGIPNFKRAYNFIAASQGDNTMLFPNPIREETLFLKLPKEFDQQDGTLFFYTLSGQLLAEEKLMVKGSIVEVGTNVTNWPKGIYLVKIELPQKSTVIKMLKF